MELELSSLFSYKNAQVTQGLYSRTSEHFRLKGFSRLIGANLRQSSVFWDTGWSTTTNVTWGSAMTFVEEDQTNKDIIYQSV